MSTKPDLAYLNTFFFFLKRAVGGDSEVWTPGLDEMECNFIVSLLYYSSWTLNNPL